MESAAIAVAEHASTSIILEKLPASTAKSKYVLRTFSEKNANNHNKIQSMLGEVWTKEKSMSVASTKLAGRAVL